MIKNKYLRKLAKNKTEITTSMVCEAERLEWEKFKDLAMSQIISANCNRYPF